jgi:hypothetical protein
MSFQFQPFHRIRPMQKKKQHGMKTSTVLPLQSETFA